MKGRILGKMGLECGKKMGLWCGNEVKERNISQNFKQHTYIYIYIYIWKNLLMWLLTWKRVRAI